jgi:hypothetical protein
LSIGDFAKAWNAEAIAYKKGPYSLWLVKEKLGTPSVKKLYKDTLVLGLENLKEKGRKRRVRGVSLYAGSLAIKKLAEDIRLYRLRLWLRFYATFTFRVSAQRCFDSSVFIKDAPFKNDYLEKASETRMQQAFRYGGCQAEASRMKFSKVAETLEEISELEEKFEEELERGLSA